MLKRLVWILPILALVTPGQAATDRVLVIVNDESPVSTEIGQYYAAKRGIGNQFICHIKVSPSEKIGLKEYHEKIRIPIKEHIQKYGLPNLDFIVTTKDVPLVDDRGFSIDSLLTNLPSGVEKQIANPYFLRDSRFKSSAYGYFIVTRLDGYTIKDVKGLIDRSVASAGKRGLILLDLDPTKDTRPGYVDLNQDIRMAAIGLAERGTPYKLESTGEFAGNYKNLIGYYSWGSNDTHFDKKRYLSNTFVPGAIAETIVSTSGRSFEPQAGGQSMIADLIQTGITGVKGYVTEPYGTSMAKASVLFDRYTKGYNLGESFYMASPFLCWKDVVIGDPLCAPYAIVPKPVKKPTPKRR